MQNMPSMLLHKPFTMFVYKKENRYSLYINEASWFGMGHWLKLSIIYLWCPASLRCCILIFIQNGVCICCRALFFQPSFRNSRQKYNFFMLISFCLFSRKWGSYSLKKWKLHFYRTIEPHGHEKLIFFVIACCLFNVSFVHIPVNRINKNIANDISMHYAALYSFYITIVRCN